MSLQSLNSCKTKTALTKASVEMLKISFRIGTVNAKRNKKEEKKKEAPFGICFLPQGLVVPPVWGKAARKLRKAWHSLYSIEQIFLLWTRSYVWFSPNSGHTPPKWPVLDCLRERDRPHCRTARRHHCRYEGQQVHTELSLLFLPPVCVCVCMCVCSTLPVRAVSSYLTYRLNIE